MTSVGAPFYQTPFHFLLWHINTRKEWHKIPKISPGTISEERMKQGRTILLQHLNVICFFPFVVVVVLKVMKIALVYYKTKNIHFAMWRLYIKRGQMEVRTLVIFWCLKTVTCAWGIWSLVSKRCNCKQSVWTERLSLGRHNGLDCTFRKWSCNPVCMEKENRSCGLKSTESQWPNTMQHKWHPFSQRGSRLIEPGNSITLSTQKQPLLPSPSSTLELRSNGRAAKNSYIVHGL